MRKATDQRDAQTISLLWTSLLLFHGGDVTCFDVCHVIWWGGHVIWCDVIACVVSRVTWRNAMSCDVRSCDVPCNGHVVYSKWFFDDVVIQSTSLYYKVLLQYYSVLQSTTPVLLCTTQYYNVLLQYYSVLLKYYSVVQSTTPVLLCTTKYYSSTTLYYKVLLCTAKYYSSTTPVLLCTTQYYNVLLQYSVLQSSIHDWSLTHMNR